jgi:N-acetylglucosamine malate deacetylase 1
MFKDASGLLCCLCGRDETSVTTLVVAAHPDDEVLGCGATIARWSSSGEDVIVAILGQGATARHISDRADDEVEQLSLSAHRASEILGVTTLKMFDFPDNRFDSVALLDLIRVVEGLVDEFQPDTVLTHHSGDLNVDHRLTYTAVLTATRPQPSHPVRNLYSWCTRSATDWAFSTLSHPFVASLYIDVTSVVDRALEAAEAYGSEFRSWPHTRSLEALETSYRHNGATVGVEAAEVFQIVRKIE